MNSKLWSGRFSEAQSDLFDAFNASLSLDSFLVHADILGSKAHVAGLHAAHILSDSEVLQLNEAFHCIESEISQGVLCIHKEDKDEDVHMWLERQLTERLGQLGKKVHTGRSRNDQVATAMKLWLKTSLLVQRAEVIRLSRTLLVLAETFSASPMPEIGRASCRARV